MIDNNKKTAFDDLSDKEIVLVIIEEDKKELFEILYNRYAPLIYRKCVGMVRDESTAKDLMQDILIKIFLNIAQFQGKSHFSLWVNTISYNHCMQYFRLKKRLDMPLVDTEDYLNISIADIEGQNKELDSIKAQQLEKFLGKLKEEYRLILYMRYFSDMSIKEIAESLEIKESAVKMRLKRGRDKLAVYFNESNTL
jgi:RNA polymerase sigma factor (sigma-70 family)